MADVIRLDSEIKELISEYRVLKLKHMHLNYLKLNSLTKDEGVIEITKNLISTFECKTDKDILKYLLLNCIDKLKDE